MSDGAPLSRDEFVERLRREGEARYHDHHRYHALMHDGKLTRLQLQQWVLNRYYYQTRIPIKDAIILSKSEDPVFRRAWIRRIQDHDGQQADRHLRQSHLLRPPGDWQDVHADPAAQARLRAAGEVDSHGRLAKPAHR